MSRRFIFTITLVFSVLLLGLSPDMLAAQADAPVRVRLVHAVSDAPPVDIYIDGALAASQLSFASNTAYISLPEGDHTITVTAAEATIAETTLSASLGQTLTTVVLGTAASPEIYVFEDDLSPLVLGNVRVNAIHAANGVGSVDVVLPDGSPVLQSLDYAGSSGGIDIPANTYPLAVVASGSPVDQAIVAPTDFRLNAGMLCRLVVLSDTSVLVLQSPVLATEDSAHVRVAHAIDGAPAVDLYANDILLITSLEAQEMTQHAALPLGTYEISVRTAGEDNVAAIATQTIDLAEAGQALTVAAVDTGETLALQAYVDNITQLDKGTARINVLNALAGSTLTAALDDGTSIAVAAPFEASLLTTEVPAGEHSILISDVSGLSMAYDLAFDGGTLYSFLVMGFLDDPIVIQQASALNLQPGSVVNVAEVAAAIEEPQPTEVVAVEETPAPAVAEPTATPAASPIAQGSAPTNGLIGLIYNLNPGANLQLREYPRADARSLGLVQAGSVLSVLGRAGEPDFPEIDLPGSQDLDPTETWVSVVLNTPDGGSITAWTIAQYVQITEDGEQVRLKDLEALRSDVAGSASGVAAPAQTTAPADTEFYAIVFNLNIDANLNIRRTPDALSEILAQLPPGTVIEPSGITEDRAWTFVTFRPEGGGQITGWVATEFVQFVFRGNDYYPSNPEKVDELIQRNLLDILTADVRGAVSGDAAAAPTAAPSTAEFFGLVFNLNPDANLNIRRTPDALSEILAQLPPGTVIEPSGITEDRAWTFVTFRPEGGGQITGWVATEFVQFVFRGNNYYPSNPEKVDELIQRNLLAILTADVRGAVSGDAAADPTAAPSTAEFFGLVFNLNPDANLNVRRTPDALSEVLVQLPPGTVIEPSGITEDRAWTYVTFLPEGGGQITGWVATDFVQFVFRGNNYLPSSAEKVDELIQRNLLALLTADVRGAVSSDIAATPTAAPSSAVFFGLVFNLNPDANLNLRRAPDALSEVLARLSPGTVIEPSGITEDRAWTFATFRPEGGGQITGWVATDFVQFVFRGNNYYPSNPDKVDELIQRNLLDILTPALRGEVSADAVPADATATPDLSAFRNQYVGTTTLDSGANLHLRRTPNAASESLALIPNGANMLVIGRTANGEWLQVEYDNAAGWVASAWVQLHINGRRVALEDVPEVQ